MSDLHTKYQLTMEVLSPVHVGTGEELIKDYDWVAHNNRTWIINQEALLNEALSEDGEFDNDLLRATPASLLRNEDYQPDSAIFRYSMPGTPTNRPLREQIKTAWGNPYLPGTSIKGMMRTLLLWGMFTSDSSLNLDTRKLGNRRGWAAQQIERELLAPASRGKDAPNKDIMKAFHVRDTDPVSPDQLHVASANIYPTGTRSSKGVNVDVEALRKGTELVTTITIDEYGFNDSRASKKLGWDGLRVWFNRLARIGQAYTRRRLGEEAEFHVKKGPSSAQYFYKELIEVELGKSEWLMQIGWGTGWKANTLNNIVTEHKRFEQDVLKKYRMGKGNYNPPSQFPKSRKLMLLDDTPAIPLGWIKCRLDLVED